MIKTIASVVAVVPAATTTITAATPAITINIISNLSQVKDKQKYHEQLVYHSIIDVVIRCIIIITAIIVGVL